MVDPATSRFLATLLAEWRWVQRLAEHLVRDPALADDVSQEAYLAEA
jgi:DNA-directed RNA polymerase specialized sigma24 family protein